MRDVNIYDNSHKITDSMSKLALVWDAILSVVRMQVYDI